MHVLATLCSVLYVCCGSFSTCRAALEEIYHRIDLDGNGAISRTEFDFFQEAVNDEVCDDDSWQVVRGELLMDTHTHSHT